MHSPGVYKALEKKSYIHTKLNQDWVGLVLSEVGETIGLGAVRL